MNSIWVASAGIIILPSASSFHLPMSLSSTPLTRLRSGRRYYLRNDQESAYFTSSGARNNGTDTQLLSSYAAAFEDDESGRPFPSLLRLNRDTVVVDQGHYCAGFIPTATESPQDDDGVSYDNSRLSSINENVFSSVDEAKTAITTTTHTASSTETAAPDNNNNDVWKARLLLLLSAALYGTNFTMVKSLDESLSVGVCSTLRFGFAALSMLPLLFAPINEELKTMTKRKNDKSKHHSVDAGFHHSLAYKGQGLLSKLGEEPTRLSAGLAGMEIGVWNSIGYIAQAVGLRTTPASTSAFICSMAVVTVPILDYIFGKRLMQRQVLGACLAALGVWALEMGGGGQQSISSLTSDDIASLIQPIMFGLGFWRMEAAMEKYPTEAGRLAAGQLLMVFLVSLSYLIGWSPLNGGDDASSLLSAVSAGLPNVSDILAWLKDPQILGMLVYTGIVTTAFTIWMETLALRTLSAAETTLIFSTEPLFGAAFAAVVAHECLGMEAAVGAACIIGGCIVSGIDFEKHFRGRLPF